MKFFSFFLLSFLFSMKFYSIHNLYVDWESFSIVIFNIQLVELSIFYIKNTYCLPSNWFPNIKLYINWLSRVFYNLKYNWYLSSDICGWPSVFKYESSYSNISVIFSYLLVLKRFNPDSLWNLFFINETYFNLFPVYLYKGFIMVILLSRMKNL